jgi:hypothetical protein
MIRTTITTLTLAAVTMIALATASPVLAAASSDEPGVTVETTVEVPDTTCSVDTDFGSIPCPIPDWTLGGLSGSEPGSGETTVVDGTSADHLSTPIPSTVSTRLAELGDNSGRPTDTIDEDAQSIIDLAQAGASVLSFDRMLVALLAVFGLLGAFGITIVVFFAVALGRRKG